MYVRRMCATFFHERTHACVCKAHARDTIILARVEVEVVEWKLEVVEWKLEIYSGRAFWAMVCLWLKIKGKGHSVNEISDPISPQAAVQQHSAVVQKTYIELRESLLTDN